MKTAKIALMVLILAAAAYPQTQDLGMGAFSSQNGAILMTIDAALVNRDLGSPYVMFMAFMASSGDRALAVAAKDVVMVYKGQEYRVPSLEELRSNYKGQIRDLDFYRHLGKERINDRWIRYSLFP